MLEGTTSFEEIYRIIEIDSDEDDDYTTELEEVVEETELKEKNKELTLTTNSNVTKEATSLINKNESQNSPDLGPIASKQTVSNKPGPQIVSAQVQTAATVTNKTSSVLTEQKNQIDNTPKLVEPPEIKVNITPPKDNSEPIITSSTIINSNNNIIENPNLGKANPTIVSESVLNQKDSPTI